VVGLGLSF